LRNKSESVSNNASREVKFGAAILKKNEPIDFLLQTHRAGHTYIKTKAFGQKILYYMNTH